MRRRFNLPIAKPKASKKITALRTMGIWLGFLIFSIALLTLLPREVHGFLEGLAR